MRRVLAASLILLAGAACSHGRKSAAGFRLPDGDVGKGRVAFGDLRCHSCHTVTGAEFPPPVADPPVALALGGLVPAPRTDGELTTAILNPSHRVSRGDLGTVTRSGRLSRMGDFSEAMTARQLVDLVAFLQSRYEVEVPAGAP